VVNSVNSVFGSGGSVFGSGGISVFRGPGSGTSDSIGPIGLPVGSFILREKATKALGFSSGGPAGGVQEFAIGGAVQRLFFGGQTLPARPDDPNVRNVQISASVGNQLKDMVKALDDLGVTSSKTADLIKKGGQISYQAAQAAFKADIQRMRMSGASATQVANAEQQLQQIRADAGKNISTRRLFSNKNGGELETLERNAQQIRADMMYDKKQILMSSLMLYIIITYYQFYLIKMTMVGTKARRLLSTG
jgi:hypothetical protein